LCILIFINSKLYGINFSIGYCVENMWWKIYVSWLHYSSQYVSTSCQLLFIFGEKYFFCNFFLTFMHWICRRVGFGAEQITRWLAERADVQVSDADRFQTFLLTGFVFQHVSNQLFKKGICCCSATWSEWMSQQMQGEFLLQFLRVIGEGRLGVLTPLGWPQWRTISRPTAWVWAKPLSSHWTSHYGEYWWWELL